MNLQEFIDTALKHGANNAADIKVSDIPFRREFRDACAKNTCGRYGTCWMCPPDVGDIDEMIARAKKYEHAFVFQYVGKLEDSFDIEGMQDAAKVHNDITQALVRELGPKLGDFIKLGAGACHVCERCARRDDMPCRYPEEALASLESYGIAVSELAALCGMKYINGANTVTYFGGLLYN